MRRRTSPASGGAPQLGYLLADRFYAVASALQRFVGELLQELNLTEALADALWQLDPDDGPQSRRALADRLHCDPSNVTFLIDRLEERGLVERVNDYRDRRIKAISLTSRGVAARDRLVAATANSPVFARLSEQQQQQLAQLLSQCLDSSAPLATSPSSSRARFGRPTQHSSSQRARLRLPRSRAKRDAAYTPTGADH